MWLEITKAGLGALGGIATGIMQADQAEKDRKSREKQWEAENKRAQDELDQKKIHNEMMKQNDDDVKKATEEGLKEEDNVFDRA